MYWPNDENLSFRTYVYCWFLRLIVFFPLSLFSNLITQLINAATVLTSTFERRSVQEVLDGTWEAGTCILDHQRTLMKWKFLSWNLLLRYLLRYCGRSNAEVCLNVRCRATEEVSFNSRTTLGCGCLPTVLVSTFREMVELQQGSALQVITEIVCLLFRRVFTL